MTRHHPIERRFGERERLGKLFRQLGTDHIHEAEAARGKIDSLLRQFGKTWADLIQLLSGTLTTIRADLAGNIAALGSSDPDERAEARRNIEDLLARHRKNWNDLADVLCASSHEAWACDPPADDPRRVNPLNLVHHLLEEYVALKPHEYIAVSLWALHTHIYDRFMLTPRLALRSPVADCGKTTLLDILFEADGTAGKVRRDHHRRSLSFDRRDASGAIDRRGGQTYQREQNQTSEVRYRPQPWRWPMPYYCRAATKGAP